MCIYRTLCMTLIIWTCKYLTLCPTIFFWEKIIVIYLLVYISGNISSNIGHIGRYVGQSWLICVKTMFTKWYITSVLVDSQYWYIGWYSGRIGLDFEACCWICHLQEICGNGFMLHPELHREAFLLIPVCCIWPMPEARHSVNDVAGSQIRASQLATGPPKATKVEAPAPRDGHTACSVALTNYLLVCVDIRQKTRPHMLTNKCIVHVSSPNY